MNVCLGLLVCMPHFHDFGNAEWLKRRVRYGPILLIGDAWYLSDIRPAGTEQASHLESLLCASFCLSRFRAALCFC